MIHLPITGIVNSDSTIVYFDSAPLTTWHAATVGGTTTAQITFTGSDFWEMNNLSSVSWYQGGQRVYCPLTSGAFVSGEYLVKYDNIVEIFGNDSSTFFTLNAVYNPGVWVEAESAYLRVLDQSANSPQLKGQVYSCDLHFAENDGGGAPVAGTIVTKPVTFISWAADAYILYDLFTDTNATNLESHTLTVTTTSPIPSWSALAGSFEIQTNKAELTSTSPTVGGMAVVDGQKTNVLWHAFVDPNSEDFALVGRVQDASNYWQLLVEDADTASPVLKLNEVISGAPTTRASKTMTGKGPVSTAGKYIQLMFNGNDIYGAFSFREGTSINSSSDAWDGVHTISYNSASYNTETRFGIQSTADTCAFDSVYMTDDLCQFITNLNELP